MVSKYEVDSQVLCTAQVCFLLFCFSAFSAFQFQFVKLMFPFSVLVSAVSAQQTPLFQQYLICSSHEIILKKIN